VQGLLSLIDPGVTNVFYLQMHLDMYGMVKVFPLKDSKFATMCLSEFVTTYKLTQYIPKTEKCLPRYLIDVKGTRKVIMQRSVYPLHYIYFPRLDTVV
jgi:hypothetical protein